MLKNPMPKKTQPVLFVFCLLALSGCLKSRFQIREQGEEPEVAKPIPAKVQEVEPQGHYAVDELRGEITRLTGRLEELERARQESAQDAQKESQLKEENRKLEARIAELEQAQIQMIEAIKKFQESKPVSASESHESFEKAKALFDASNYDGAVEAFSQYLKRSKAPKAEAATFYRAESYFHLKQYKKAIVDYSQFTEKYNRSRHLPAALLKIGLSFEALTMKDDAKGFFQEVVDKFPKSAEAKKARAKLK